MEHERLHRAAGQAEPMEHLQEAAHVRLGLEAGEEGVEAGALGIRVVPHRHHLGDEVGAPVLAKTHGAAPADHIGVGTVRILLAREDQHAVFHRHHERVRIERLHRPREVRLGQGDHGRGARGIAGGNGELAPGRLSLFQITLLFEAERLHGLRLKGDARGGPLGPQLHGHGAVVEAPVGARPCQPALFHGHEQIRAEMGDQPVGVTGVVLRQAGAAAHGLLIHRPAGHVGRAHIAGVVEVVEIRHVVIGRMRQRDIPARVAGGRGRIRGGLRVRTPLHQRGDARGGLGRHDRGRLGRGRALFGRLGHSAAS